MTRQKQDVFLASVQSFFVNYLKGMRGASDHTIRAYRDTLKLFFLYLNSEKNRNVANLTLDDIQAEAVLGFLNHCEFSRGNSPATRNCRLAAIRCFSQHLLRNDVTRADQYGRILSIPAKRSTARPTHYLEPEQVRIIIAAVDPKEPNSVRDRALLLFLYNTGARVSEALDVRQRDLHLERPRQVRLRGKGGKERICPLWSETASALRQLIKTELTGEFIFQNALSNPLTRDGVAYLIEKYVRRASGRLPNLNMMRVTPHIFRHSCAVALLQAGVDITVIRDYLGHATVATTNRYVTSNLKMRRDVLEAFWKRAGLEPEREPRRRWRPSQKLLIFLESL
jgi:site-specific recombinase XerD